MHPPLSLEFRINEITVGWNFYGFVYRLFLSAFPIGPFACVSWERNGCFCMGEVTQYDQFLSGNGLKVECTAIGPVGNTDLPTQRCISAEQFRLLVAKLQQLGIGVVQSLAIFIVQIFPMQFLQIPKIQEIEYLLEEVPNSRILT